MNVNDALELFSEDSINVGNKESGTSDFNQVHDKFQVKQDKAQTRKLLQLEYQKVNGRINQWKLIMIISTATQNITTKLWTDYFVSVNLHPHNRFYFSDCIKKIAPYVNMGETEYFRNHEGSYYDAMPYVWENRTVIKWR